MKTPEISFRPIGDSGPLTLYWYPGPYSDAVECDTGKGVAWISPGSELLGVEFDDVNTKNDHQILETRNGSRIKVIVKNRKVKVYRFDRRRKQKILIRSHRAINV